MYVDRAQTKVSRGKAEVTHAVSSWPPPGKPVLQNIPAGLPASAWDAHSSWVASKNALNWAAITPKREGNPKIKPSASWSCSGLISATSFALVGAFIFWSITSESVSGTWSEPHQSDQIKQHSVQNNRRPLPLLSFPLFLWYYICILLHKDFTCQSVASTPWTALAPRCTSLAIISTCPCKE